MTTPSLRWYSRTISLALLFCATLAACGAGSEADEAPTVDASGVIRHPVEAYAPYRDLPARVMTLNEVRTGGEPWETFLAVGPDAVSTVGGDAETPFGEITHVARFQDGFVVADDEEHRVHFFGGDGDVRGVVGRFGDGPGEFRRITAVVQVGSRTLAVADVMRRVDLFEMTDSLRFLRRVTLDFGATAICTMGDRIYVYSLSMADTLPPIRVLDTAWTEQGRIGASYRSPNPMINSALGESVALLCAPELQRLVVIPRASLGDIYLLEADGTPVVRYQWSDYRGIAMLEDAVGYTALFDSGGVNRHRSGAVIDDSLALIQYEYLSYADLEAHEGATTIQTVVLNLKTGEVVHRTSDWPVVLDFGSGGAVEMLDTDWPGFRVYRRVGR
jgi:hypothetical protein